MKINSSQFTIKKFTHIRIEPIPQLMDDGFYGNMDICDKQKQLAEAAPDLLAALHDAVRLLKLAKYPMTGTVSARILAAIDKATL